MVNLINFENRRCEKWKWYSPSLFRPSIYIKWRIFLRYMPSRQQRKKNNNTKLQPVVLISCHADVSWHWAVIHESKTQNEILCSFPFFLCWKKYYITCDKCVGSFFIMVKDVTRCCQSKIVDGCEAMLNGVVLIIRIFSFLNIKYNRPLFFWFI